MLTKSNVSTKLFELRTEYGVTQEDICNSTGISRVTITSLEKGRSTPHAKTLFKLIKYFQNKHGVKCVNEP